MKKHFNKTSKHLHHKIGLGIYGPGLGYYAYPPVTICVHKVPPVHIQQSAPLIWNPRLLRDQYTQLMPPTLIKIEADYIGRFI